ncbi:hypothetical protein [Dryocola clanedunensis]
MNNIKELSLDEIAMVSGGITAALPSTSGSASNNKGGGWHDTNPGGMVGECRW